MQFILARNQLILLVLGCVVLVSAVYALADDAKKPLPPTTLLTGTVKTVDEQEALRLGFKPVQSRRELTPVFYDIDNNPHELHQDVRGRSFRKDKRLCNRPVVLTVRKDSLNGPLRVVRVYVVDKSQVKHLDYWCEICAIAMYELKACDCCQGDIELRLRNVADPRKR